MQRPLPPIAVVVAVALATAALAAPARAASADLHSRPMSGSCDAAPVVVPSPAPDALFRVTITGTCQLTHLGRTDFAAVEDVYLSPAGLFLAGSGSYTAANGDRLFTSFIGPVEQTGPSSVSFSGAETFIGGTGSFTGAVGSFRFVGGADVAPPGLPGVGWLTVEGSISY